MRRIVNIAIIAGIMLLGFVVPLPAQLFSPLYYSVYADASESWLLKNGVLLTTNHGMAKVIKADAFQNMVIKISNGMVSSNFPIPINLQDKNGSFTGTVTYTLQGSYSGASGMAGTYTCSIDGIMSSKEESEKFVLALTGPFSGPGGLAEGKTVTVSFAEGIGPPIPGCEESGKSKLDPFSLSFAIAKPSLIPTLPASSPIKPPVACKLPTLRK
jgi:hypothetical protein